MHKVEIKYKSLFGFYKSKKVSVPDKWEDLSSSQFSACNKVYTSSIKDLDFVKEYFGLSSRLISQLTDYEILKLTELADFALKPEGLTNFFFIKRLGGKLISPKDRLKEVTLEHFVLFDTAFFDYVKSPTSENLKKFVGMVYLKEGEKLTSIDFDKRMKMITKKVKISDCHAIFLNYIFIHRWLNQAYPFLFEEKEKPKNQNAKTNLQAGPDWMAIIDSFVGDDMLNFDKYVNMPATNAFKAINNRIKTYKSYE
jgi:hypothetical protein